MSLHLPRLLLSSLLLALPSAWMLQAAETHATFKLDASSFRCMREMTPVRHFYVDNLAGNLDGTLAAANASDGAIYRPDRWCSWCRPK